MGSPPHTWRIPLSLNFFNSGVRITSTYVENTDHENSTDKQGEDHLHIRGEYMAVETVDQFQTGSPPHTWRILVELLTSFKNDRITSTYVENTYL